MFAIENAEDFEMYSSTSAGGIQGLGYQCRNAGYVAFIKSHTRCMISERITCVI